MFATMYIITNTCCLCDAMTCLCDVNKYGEVDFMSIVMSDDDMLLCGLYVLSHIHFISEEGFYAKRWWLLCRAKLGFMPSVPNYGQSDGYHMHNIVVSHGVHYVYFGVGYVYVRVVYHWVLNWWMIIELRRYMVFCVDVKIMIMWWS